MQTWNWAVLVPRATPRAGGSAIGGDHDNETSPSNRFMRRHTTNCNFDRYSAQSVVGRVVSQGNYVTIKRSSQADATLGNHIRARRKSIGMTQSELASSMGISFQQIQKYEKGINAISMSRLQQICDIMNLSPDYFLKASSDYLGKAAQLDAVKTSDQAKMQEQFLATSEGKHLVQCFMQIRDGKLRTRILDFIAAVAADQPD